MNQPFPKWVVLSQPHIPIHATMASNWGSHKPYSWRMATARMTPAIYLSWYAGVFWSFFTANNNALFLEQNAIWVTISTRRDMKMKAMRVSSKNIMLLIPPAAFEVKWPLLVKWLTKWGARRNWAAFHDVMMRYFILLRRNVPGFYVPRWDSVGRCTLYYVGRIPTLHVHVGLASSYAGT